MNETDSSIPPLLTIGHPLLAQPSRPVTPEELGTQPLLDRLLLLEEAMNAFLGIGLAAPQVGWFERFFLMTASEQSTRKSTAQSSAQTTGDEPVDEIIAWINPEILFASKEFNWSWEGCLSVPGLRGWIRRPAALTVKGFDASGQQISREFNGWEARVFQHEFDHLEGMLFPYRTKDPRHLVSNEELENQTEWPEGWPAPGARETPMGEVFPDTGE